jgi:hypothetical protein
VVILPIRFNDAISGEGGMIEGKAPGLSAGFCVRPNNESPSKAAKIIFLIL